MLLCSHFPSRFVRCSSNSISWTEKFSWLRCSRMSRTIRGLFLYPRSRQYASNRAAASGGSKTEIFTGFAGGAAMDVIVSDNCVEVNILAHLYFILRNVAECRTRISPRPLSGVRQKCSEEGRRRPRLGPPCETIQAAAVQLHWVRWVQYQSNRLRARNSRSDDVSVMVIASFSVVDLSTALSGAIISSKPCSFRPTTMGLSSSSGRTSDLILSALLKTWDTGI